MIRSYDENSLLVNFERKFAHSINSSQYLFSILLASEIDTFKILLNALDISPNDEVIVPIYSPPSLFMALIEKKCDVRYCPISKDLTINHHALEDLITSKTKLIIVSYIDGLLCDIDKILSITNKYNIKLIEDCTQSYLATFRGNSVGTKSYAACFSLSASPYFNCDSGGLVICRDKNLYKKMILISNPLYFINHKKKFNLKLDFSKLQINYSFASLSVANKAERHLMQAPLIIQKQQQIKENIIKQIVQYSHSFIFFPQGKDNFGETANAIHIELKSLAKVINYSKQLQQIKIFSHPLMAYNGYFPWHWENFLPPISNETKIQTLNITKKILRIPINYLWTQATINQIIKILTN